MAKRRRKLHGATPAQVRDAKLARQAGAAVPGLTRGRRKGAGTYPDDVWNPEAHASNGASIEDERRGKSYCRTCNAEVQVLEVEPGSWATCDLDASPHACKETP